MHQIQKTENNHTILKIQLLVLSNLQSVSSECFDHDHIDCLYLQSKFDDVSEITNFQE